jgi:CotH kinase protein/Lamin Tail Domain
LKYLVMFGAEQTVNMTPTGTPNVYTAQIPTATLGPGQMLRWRVVATDNTSVTGTAPEFSDPLDNDRYYGTVAVDSTIQTSLPVLYFFVADTNAPNNATGTRCSFFFKAIGETGVGRFYDNVEANLHGQSSSGFNKKSYDIDFNEDNRFEWNVANKWVKDVNLLTNWGHKSKTHNQMTHEALAAVGSVHHWCHQVRVQQVTTANAATPANHFFSIADMLEDGDDDFMERNGRDPLGALYKIYDSLSGTGSAEKKTRTHEDKSDLQALINGLNTANSLTLRRQYGYDNLDLPQCVSYFVGLAIASSQDHGHKNFYVYRDSVGTREWAPLPWDVDLTWGRNWLDASGYFTDTIFTNNDLDMYNSSQQGKGENRLYSLIVGNSDVGRAPAPEIRNMVLRRLRTVMDGYFSAPDLLENRFTQLADLMDPPSIGTSDADRDYTKWGTWGSDGGNTAGGTALRYHINQIRNVYLPGRRTFLNTATLAGVAVPASQPANGANLITLETVDFNPASGTQEHEYFLIRNANTYAVDISGWQITGAVSWTFKGGTVIPAGGGTTENIGHLFMAKNPWLFRQRAVSPKAGQFCFVQGPYNGQLSARGETIELRDAAGTLLKTKTWTPAPTALQNQLRVTELNYAPVAPTTAESAALPGVTKGDYEFIELANIGATALTLTGANFDKGVTFTFPALTLAGGARTLVVANVAAFQLRYGHAFDTQIAGVFTGNFDDGGETIQLLDNVGESILEFTYDNAWFPPSDEGGRTLVARTASPDWAGYETPANWALSGNVNGSPGSADTDFANVYEGWRYDYFSTAEFPTVSNPFALAAVTVDAEGDLLINLSEYAFGGNPRVHDNRALATHAVVNVGGTDYCAIVFTRRHLALDLTYTVEVSGDLATWNAVDLPVGAPVDLGGGLERVTYRDQVPAGAAPRFLRVRAVK